MKKKMTALLVLVGFLCWSPAGFAEQKVAISTPDAPAAIGPYSQAIKYGHLVFLSGQLPIDPATGQIPPNSDITVQTKQVMQNLGAVLAAAKLTFDDVLMSNVYLANINDFAAFNAEYAKYFGSDPPARATVQVGAIPRGALVEIWMIAGK